MSPELLFSLFRLQSRGGGHSDGNNHTNRSEVSPGSCIIFQIDYSTISITSFEVESSEIFTLCKIKVLVKI